MKNAFIILLSASFALPGCITQRRVAQDMEAAQAQVDSIMATLPQVGLGLPNLVEPPPKPKPIPYVEPAATVILPADTASVTVAVNDIPEGGKVVDTGNQTVTVRHVHEPDGNVSVSVEAVTKPKPVQVFVPTPTQAPEPEQPTWLHIILFIVAGLGLGAQMFIKWLNDRK
jgi:hypothetical protein